MSKERADQRKFESLLEELCDQHGNMRQYVDRRKSTLLQYTERELRKWFQSSGLESPDLGKIDERKASAMHRKDRLAYMQARLVEETERVELAVARRCRGWTAAT